MTHRGGQWWPSRWRMVRPARKGGLVRGLMNTTETKQQVTMKEWCERERIGMLAQWSPSNPNMPDDPKCPMNHWRCKLNSPSGATMVVIFSMGMGLGQRKPTVEEVVNCLASDYVDRSTSFEDWCNELGYDSDSRKAETTFQACLDQSGDLRELLGSQALLEELCYEVERL